MVYGLSINTNINALLLQNSLNRSIIGYNKAAERLSTGLRINSAADDPAGLVMAENFKTRVNEANVAIQSAQFGSSFLDTVEYTYSAIAGELDDIKDIAVAAQSTTLTTAERDALQEELVVRQDAVKEYFNSNYNNKDIFDDDNSKTIYLGTEMSAFSIGTSFTNEVAAAELAGSGDWYDLLNGDVTSEANALALETIIKSTDDGGNGLHDSMLLQQSKAGVDINILENNITMLQTKKLNYMAVESSIRDADIATETINATKYQLLQQAATTLLSQANLGPSLALSLISSI